MDAGVVCRLVILRPHRCAAIEQGFHSLVEVLLRENVLESGKVGRAR